MKMGFFAVRAILAVRHECGRKGQKGFFVRRSVTVKAAAEQQMSARQDEVSIRRCTWLLTQRGCTFRREAEIGQVLTLKDSNPDFLVETPDRIRFLLELKSVGEQDTLLDRIDPSVTVFSIDSMSLQKRANRLVRDAANQLAPYAPEALPMVVMLDNHRQKGISLDKHTLRALFGELVVTIPMNPTTGGMVDDAEWTHEDDNSPLAAGRNAHASAVAVLIPVHRFDTWEKSDDYTVERTMKVRLLHNPYAIVPLPASVFSDAVDEVLT
jgi:hypothetical protein